MPDESEEKSLPATQKKLRDARKRGQVAHSSDTITAANFLVVLMLFFTIGGLMWDRMGRSVTGPLDAIERANVYDGRFETFLEQAVQPIISSAVTAAMPIMPFLALAVIATIAASFALHKGFIFSFEPMKPTVDKLNPIEGFKRIYGKRGVVEFGKALAKAIVMSVIVVAVTYLGIDAMLRIGDCGMECLSGTVRQLFFLTCAAAAMMFIATAGIDIILQRQLFLDEMKMTKTEAKKERKEQDGDPMIKGARKRLQREAANQRFQVGVKAASLFVYDSGAIAGMRYVTAEAQVPILVCRARSPGDMRVMAEARARGVPIVREPELTKGLMSGAAVGEPIPRETFSAAARVLQQVGLSG